jgi:uncharacterized protein (DUF1697 family)
MSKSTYILLLRGINVSGKNLIKMVDLKAALDKALTTNCTTYIQSGNILFTYDNKSMSTLEKKIDECLFVLFQTSIQYQLLTSTQLESLINHNPFNELPIETVYITICKSINKTFNPLPIYPPDEAIVINSNVYIKCLNGYGKTKYTNAFIEKKFNTTATTRNWKTILTLQKMLMDF